MKVKLSARVRDLAEVRCATEYGLTLDDLDKLGIEIYESATQIASHFYDVPCLKINYYDPLTKQPLITWPGHPPFYRLRHLIRTPPNGSVGFDGKPIKELEKYTQEAGSVNGIYFPRMINWEVVLSNPLYDLTITEGEFKAAKAGIHGHHVIAIGGITMTRATKRGIDHLPDFDRIECVRRTLHICFDSDIIKNPDISTAANDLAGRIKDRGAFPFIMTVPPDGDKKMGLDNHLIKYGAESFEQLKENSQPLHMVKALFDLNQEVAYVVDPGMIIRASGQKQRVSDFENHAFKNVEFYEKKVVYGKIMTRRANLGAVWLEWPLQTRVDRLSYEPGVVERVIERDGKRFWNTWLGWGCAPKKGNPKPFLDLIGHLFTNADSTWPLQWLAYPLQHPGTKLFTSILIHGRRTGTGKSLIGETMRRIYGSNFGEITNNDIGNTYTHWAENKQFIHGDEVHSLKEKRSESSFFKNLITQTSMTINGKYIPHFTINTRANYLWTTNWDDPLALEDDDRRFYVHKVTVGPREAKFYRDYFRWLDQEGGAAIVFYYLLNLNLTGFDPFGRAPETEAKKMMIEANRSDAAVWAHNVIDDPDKFLRTRGGAASKRDLWSAQQLVELFAQDYPHAQHLSLTLMGRVLAEAGVPHVMNVQIRGAPEGGRQRFYIVRNAKRWIRPGVTVQQVLQHLNETWG